MLDPPLAPCPQLDAKTKDPSDSTNINISSSINSSNNIINTTGSQTILLSIQQLQQILGLHGQNMAISVVQAGQTTSSQTPQSIRESHMYNGLQNPLVTTLQSHCLNHVPTFPGIHHNIPANQISTLNSSPPMPRPSTGFMPQNGMSNSHSSSSMDISQGLDGVLTYKGVNYVRQDQAPALQPIIIVMGGSSPQCLPNVPAVPQIQPLQGYCRPDDPAEEQVDDQRSAVDEQEDSVGNVEDHLEDFSPEDQDRNCISGPSMKDSGMILNFSRAQLSQVK